MIIELKMNLDLIIKALNEKRYAQNEALTLDEQTIISTYKPEKCFIVYGTLAPNRPNHHIVEHIQGNWIE